MTTWVVILAGGVGSRFWPLSTPERPKQLLPLVTDQPMIADAVTRVAPLVPAERTLILTNGALASPISAALPLLPRMNILVEPKPSGTAAALAWAATEIARRSPEGSRPCMISLHADWAVGDPGAFREALQRAVTAAEQHRALVTVGVVPRWGDPGLGYIDPGPEMSDGLRCVVRFIEKPARPAAEDLVRRGCLWNSGIFVWPVDVFLDELRAHTPEIREALDNHSGDREAFFAAVTPVSVDVGLLERSRQVLVVAGTFAWDDVGTWGALRRVRALDQHGNAVAGRVHAVDASGNVASSERDTIVLYGVEDLVVVQHAGVLLVTTVERSADLKRLMEALPSDVATLPRRAG